MDQPLDYAALCQRRVVHTQRLNHWNEETDLCNLAANRPRKFSIEHTGIFPNCFELGLELEDVGEDTKPCRVPIAIKSLNLLNRRSCRSLKIAIGVERP